MSKNHETDSAPHLAYRTQMDRTGERNMINRKPYRTAEQKKVARASASKDHDGAYRTTAPVSVHTKVQTTN